MIDHYKVLGLPSGEEGRRLTTGEIRKAYKIKALELHPDKRPTDPDANVKFQKLLCSYEFLMDEKSRRDFDDLLQRRSSSSSSSSCQGGGFWCDDDDPESPTKRKMRSDLEEKLRKEFIRRVEEEIARFRVWLESQCEKSDLRWRRRKRKRNGSAETDKFNQFQSDYYNNVNYSGDGCRWSQMLRSRENRFVKSFSSVRKATLKAQQEERFSYNRDF